MGILNNSNAIPVSGAYELEDSLRFRSSASAYLNRTPASASNRKTWTFSCWVKRGALGGVVELLGSNGSTDNTNFAIEFDNDNIFIGVYNFVVLKSTAVLRDPSAWYHLVVTFDSTQSTASNRVKVYINGVEITSWSTDNRASITLNGDYGINNNTIHNIGRNPVLASRYYDGYLTEINLVDGTALTPSDFGETDDNGTWIPKRYTGTYGTNGFYLPMNETRDSIVTDYLVIAGGGSGGSRAAGGGGAGGYLTGTAYLKPSTTYTITVGAGGAAVVSMPGTRGNNGTNSVLSGTRISTITSIGGGGGGVYPGSTSLVATTGGSGGGGGSVLGSTSGAGAAGTASQGNAGGNGAPDAYHGGGGGGAGSVGSNGSVSVGGAGGSGSASSITGSSITRAGGGGGSPSGSASGGGGTGGAFANGNATAGTVNTGGGGGGARNASDTTNVYSGAGGSGVVILRLLTSEYSSTTTGSPTVTTDGSYTILTYTSSGTYTT